MFSPFNCFRDYIFFATKYLSFTIRSWIVLTYLSFANSSCSFLSPNPREDNILANSFSAFSSRLKVVRIAIFLSFDIEGYFFSEKYEVFTLCCPYIVRESLF